MVEISSAFKLDRDLIDGVEVEEGDIWIDIDIDDLPIPAKDVISVEYGDDDDDYTIMAKDNAGIGATNRVIMVGRLTG
ncbi:hypothetical protein [Oceanobacillus limi]|uniref:hypothetical protein n=1 Tax=Oceanobacillus limi TaxID=930131 RepID=UPI001479C6D6|nr:hypothetical protein [Oceanobacillus limi]